ncbi:MAG: EF-P lysine aminoacylase GenX [Gammaproteobacteria bacterium]|nr:EF-P lysine aminoacylase GenX [Gammaproteobacteria bacterium]
MDGRSGDRSDAAHGRDDRHPSGRREVTGWRPASGPRTARTRAEMLGRIRDYFVATGALEVDTPALSVRAASDPQIESFEITSSNVDPRPLFLHTSPEFCMKRLLAADYPDIFSICRVFRDGECGKRHQPEFTMIEWYRRDHGLNEIIADTLDVIRAALGAAAPHQVRQFDYSDLFVEHFGIDPHAASVDALARLAGADASLSAALGDERDDWLNLILSSQIVPGFAADQLTVLRHYPASQAALARLCPDDPLVADRFEVFVGPVELANGYVELTDAAEQRQRFEQDNQERRRRRRPVRPIDGALLAALEHGLPACAGVALGFERLHMLHDASDDIRHVLTFAFEDNA